MHAVRSPGHAAPVGWPGFWLCLFLSERLIAGQDTAEAPRRSATLAQRHAAPHGASNGAVLNVNKISIQIAVKTIAPRCWEKCVMSTDV